MSRLVLDRLFRDLAGACPPPQGSVACIGAFDGLHLGHRALLRHAVARARTLGVPAVALTFEPLPREFFARGEQPPRLMLARAKVEGLYEAGIDSVGLLRFGQALAAMPAEAFVQRVLVERLAVREVWVGQGFRFGKGRAGDLSMLQAIGEARGFLAGAIEPVRLGGERVSSTRIRELLAEGDFDGAAALLGARYRIGGRVVRGSRLGRTLGYPTANLRFGNRVPALRGIYAARVRGVGDDSNDSRPWPAVASFGTRPTVDGREPLLEAHLFDFDGDLYGKRIEVEFVARLRDEEKFPDLPSLVAQMHVDAAQAREALRKHSLQHDAPQRATA